jgi:hypothetical protein
MVKLGTEVKQEIVETSTIGRFTKERHELSY